MARNLVLLAALLAPISGAAAQAVPEWKLVEEWRVGGEPSGGNSFDSNMGFALLPKGGFVHLDSKGYQLHFLDAKGKVVRSVGRRGEGPGEFGRLKGLMVTPAGTIVVNDITNGFLFFTQEGKFIKAVKMTKVPYFANGKAWNAVPQPDGRVLDVMSLIASQNNGRNEARILWAADFSKYDTLPAATCGTRGAPAPAVVGLKDATGKLVVNMPVMFAEPFNPVTYGTDGLVWEPVPRNSNTLVRHKLSDCAPIAQAKLDGVRTPMGPDERKMIVSQIEAEAKRWKFPTPDLSTIPKEQAWFMNALVDTRGNLWVERNMASAPKERTDVFSAAGKPIGMIKRQLPGVSRITDSYVYGFENDDDDVRYLVAYRIVKQ